MRVRYYYCRSVYEDGSVMGKDYPFTEAIASAAGAVLEPDGIPYEVAQRLVDGWNREASRHKPRRYYYDIRAEDQLTMVDQTGQLSKNT
jgi:hypothetical protein